MRKNRRSGQSLVEYAVILVLLCVAVLLTLSITGVSLQKVYCSVVRGIGGNGPGCDSVYCQDDFNNLNNWSDKSGWETRDGQICNKLPPNPNKPNLNTCSQAQNIPSDYEITLEIANLMSGSGYGIFFRVQPGSPTNAYIFQFDPGLANSFVFRKWINGSESGPIARYIPPSGYVWFNTSHHIRVVVLGSTFRAYVDNELVLTANDSSYTSGGAGLRVWDSTSACFDNFSVRPIQ